LIINIINYLLVAAGGVALLFMVWGGIRMLLSGGNPEQVKTGKTTLYNALVGFVIVMAAYIIINLVLAAVGASPGNFQNLINLWS
jgi:hypothetical protein